MQEEDPELKLAVSYYHLYNASQNEEPQVSAGKKTVRETKTVEGSATTAASLFWVEDTSWTEKDESEAKETLRRTAMRCSYRPSGTDQGKEDDYDAAAWNKFYIDHQTNFFKDRHYFATAFPSEFGDIILTVSDDRANDPQLRCLVEIGCGVGNALLPLLQEEEIDLAGWIRKDQFLRILKSVDESGGKKEFLQVSTTLQNKEVPLQELSGIYPGVNNTGIAQGNLWMLEEFMKGL